jgi:DNA-binding response OmpR family regulator
MAKVLIVEDDEVIAKAMATHLAASGFDPLYVGKGRAGLARLRFERPDVCVLDLMLPELDGWELISTARSEGIGTPIVVVSARGTEHDRVRALDLGADDYLVKPFSMRELVARVRAAARRGVRAEQTTRGEPLEVEELIIDPHVVQAYVAGQSAELTPTEFRLLHALALERGRVVTRATASATSSSRSRKTAALHNSPTLRPQQRPSLALPGVSPISIGSPRKRPAA